MKRRLGVNIDHIATLREARGEFYPDPFLSLEILKKCRVDQVTVHLREDRRHMQDQDVHRIVKAKILPVNLEIAVTQEMLKLALKLKPKMVTFVPEKRQELTTEGGLNCLGQTRLVKKLRSAIEELKSKGIHVSLFLDPDPKQIQAAKDLKADAVEIHTGAYCQALEKKFFNRGQYKPLVKYFKTPIVRKLLNDIRMSALLTQKLGLKVYAGHGLHTHNLKPITGILPIEEYNIGHAIIARSVFVGLEQAIKEIQKVLKG
jgi:pyridoxine 5-phosphate synthase